MKALLVENIVGRRERQMVGRPRTRPFSFARRFLFQWMDINAISSRNCTIATFIAICPSKGISVGGILGIMHPFNGAFLTSPM
jgi:hypothetical protein